MQLHLFNHYSLPIISHIVAWFIFYLYSQSTLICTLNIPIDYCSSELV